MGEMLQAALQYHSEGLCVIPVREREKMPALASWEEYQTRCSTRDEVLAWFGNGSRFNIGIVHGINGHVAIDIDHDAGLLDTMRAQFPHLFTGRLEQSGSGEGFHVPLRLDELPDFGTNSKDNRPRGNRTWKTDKGHANCRCRHCQTVVPPSIHPSGNRYRFIQEGPITHVHDLSDVIAWLNELAPPPAPRPAPGHRHDGAAPSGNDLVSAVRAAWPSALDVFSHFGIVGHTRQERDGETRILGHGGLLVADDDPQTWYCFADEVGGGVFEAWGWCRFGSAYDKRRHFRQVLLEMAQAAGIDAARFYKRGDERLTRAANGDRGRWTREYAGQWGRMR